MKGYMATVYSAEGNQYHYDVKEEHLQDGGFHRSVYPNVDLDVLYSFYGNPKEGLLILATPTPKWKLDKSIILTWVRKILPLVAEYPKPSTVPQRD